MTSCRATIPHPPHHNCPGLRSTPFYSQVECPWCEGVGRTPCDVPWCSDPEHEGTCNYCLGDGEVRARWQPDRQKWLIRVPTWAVRVTLVNPTTSPQETP